MTTENLTASVDGRRVSVQVFTGKWSSHQSMDCGLESAQRLLSREPQPGPETTQTNTIVCSTQRGHAKQERRVKVSDGSEAEG
jgi:hypothetical protein